MFEKSIFMCGYRFSLYGYRFKCVAYVMCWYVSSVITDMGIYVCDCFICISTKMYYVFS